MTRIAAALLLFVAACSTTQAPSKASTSMQQVHGEKLIYGEHGIVNLQGPSGQVIQLQRDGVNTIQWNPVDMRTLEMELRIRVRSYGFDEGGLDNGPPIVRARVQYGHGKLVWDEPFGALPWSSGSVQYVNLGVPARGVVWRFAAREIKVLLQSPYSREDPAYTYPTVDVWVSFAPVISSEVPLFARNDYGLNAASGTHEPWNAFPAGATEWRVFDLNGQPFPPGSNNVFWVGLAASFTGTIALENLADFQPIPYDATGWLGFPGDKLYVEYR